MQTGGATQELRHPAQNDAAVAQTRDVPPCCECTQLDRQQEADVRVEMHQGCLTAATATGGLPINSTAPSRVPLCYPSTSKTSLVLLYNKSNTKRWPRAGEP